MPSRQDFLPDPSLDDFLAYIFDLCAHSAGFPDDVLVFLVGNMVLKEALLAYLTMLNTLDVIRDKNRASVVSWAVWG